MSKHVFQKIEVFLNGIQLRNVLPHTDGLQVLSCCGCGVGYRAALGRDALVLDCDSAQ